VIINLFIVLCIFSVYCCGVQSHENDYPEPDEPYVKTIFRDDFNSNEIDISVWQVATWTEHGGQTSASRCYALDGYLHMVFINDSTDGYLSAAIQTRNEFYYGRWEARIKPTDIPGVLNSFYTIDWNNTIATDSDSDGTKQEIDIEFLTYTFGEGSGKVHFAVHESGKESFETNPDINLDFDPSADFHLWGFEITPEHIEWFVDDQVLLTYTYNGNPIAITAPYQLKLNVWSSENWILGPPQEDVECVYLIDWIKFTPYE
ncbi:MAG: glycoside hydrolase family 16 protein, partial [Spirochaetales bacterium]|nr:glycoside hydrolase family 16 protein [Spirochaetales bacterium]